MLLRPLLLSVLLAASAAGAGNVHVVPPGGNLQAAIDAAGDGDLIRVQPGPSHGSILIQGKGLSLVGDGGPFTVFTVTVHNTQAHQPVTIHGMRANPIFIGQQPIYTQEPLRILTCNGPVVVEDFVVPPGAEFGILTAGGCIIDDSSSVALVRCEIVASRNAVSAPIGLLATDSRVALYDCDVTGGDGRDAVTVFGPIGLFSTDGGLGAELRGDSELLCSGTTIRGGQGGDGAQESVGSCDLPPADGGDGLRAPFGSKPTLRLLDSQILPGAAGTPALTCPPTAQPGQAFYAGPWLTIEVINESARSLVADAIMKEASNGSISLTGAPGELAFLLISPTLDVTYVQGLAGTLVPAFPLILAPVGTLDAAGNRTLSVPVPTNAIPPGCGFVPVLVQMLVAGTSGTGVLGSASVVALLPQGA